MHKKIAYKKEAKKPEKIKKVQNDPLADFPILMATSQLFTNFSEQCQSCKGRILNLCVEPQCKCFFCFNCTADFEHLGHRNRTIETFCRWMLKEKELFTSEQITFLKYRAKCAIDMFVQNPSQYSSGKAKEAFKDLETALEFPKELIYLTSILKQKGLKIDVATDDASLMKRLLRVNHIYLSRMVLSTHPGHLFPIIKYKFRHTIFNEVESDAMISAGILYNDYSLYTLNPCTMKKRGWFGYQEPKCFKNIRRARFLRCNHHPNCYPVETENKPFPIPLTELYASSDLPSYPTGLKKFALMIHNDKWTVSRNDFLHLLPSGIVELQIQIHVKCLKNDWTLALPLKKFEQLRVLWVWIEQWPSAHSKKLLYACSNHQSLTNLCILKGNVSKCLYRPGRTAYYHHYRRLINSDRRYRRVLSQVHLMWREMKQPSGQFVSNVIDYLNPLQDNKSEKAAKVIY